MTGTDRKVFSRAFRSRWDRENRWRIDGDMAEWSLWHSDLTTSFVACLTLLISTFESISQFITNQVSDHLWWAQSNEEPHRVLSEHPPRVITKSYHSPLITVEPQCSKHRWTTFASPLLLQKVTQVGLWRRMENVLLIEWTNIGPSHRALVY